MLITKTPFRISFFGGGTDYPDYYMEHGGCVLSTTIDKYCYLSMRHLPPFFDYKNQLTYSSIERFNEPDEVRHPLVRCALQFIPTENIQIAYDADLPASSGIGSSSAFAVGLMQGLHAMRNEFPDRMTLAKEAIHVEREMCREAGGVQDQLAAAFGGFNRMDFSADGFTVAPVDVPDGRLKALQENLMLLFTGFTHFSGAVAEEQQKNIPSTLRQLDELKQMVGFAEGIVRSGDLDDFGRLLDLSWELKRSLSKRISNFDIDFLYRKLRAAGARGGKLLGAGGGGFMLLYVPKEEQEAFRETFAKYRFFPFAFENTGTQILYQNEQ
ncbi:MAG: kinase [Clostridia bacterium]|nr:kinase [Clostridia bacterium]